VVGTPVRSVLSPQSSVLSPPPTSRLVGQPCAFRLADLDEVVVGQGGDLEAALRFGHHAVLGTTVRSTLFGTWYGKSPEVPGAAQDVRLESP